MVTRPSDKVKSPRQRQPLSVVEPAALPPVSGLNISQTEPGWLDVGAELGTSVPSPRHAHAFASADGDGGSLPPPPRPSDKDADAAVGGTSGARSMSPTMPASPRTRGVLEFASVEAVNEAVDERTAVLTKIFQERLARQLAALQGMRDAESRAHEKEVKQLKQAFEERLNEAVEKVRAVHATNRDAVAILAKNKKLRTEVAQLKHALVGAQNAQRDAEARERQRMEDGAAVVQQLMAQLQEKEALLAAGAGAMTEEEREEMLERERQRAQAKMDKEKKRIEAAAAEEMQKVTGRVKQLEDELRGLQGSLDEATRTAKSATRKLEVEREAHKETAEKLAQLEKVRQEEAWKLEKLKALDVKVTGAMRQIHAALGKIRGFLEETEEHLKVDLCCLCCLNPLLDPQVLVPCGHSVCRTCYQALDASTTALDPCKYCPVCKANAAKASVEDGDGAGAGGDAQPVEGFQNTMLDLCLQRLRTKVQNVEAFLNLVGGIFTDVAPPESPKGASAHAEDAGTAA